MNLSRCLILTGLVLTSCSFSREAPMVTESKADKAYPAEEPEADEIAFGASPAAATPAAAPARMRAKKSRRGGRRDQPKPKLSKGGGPGGMEMTPADEGLASIVDGEPAEPVATRAWFPESFLFAPRVVTDAGGAASVDVTVPDRLTTWRILALAHSREGKQAGAVAQFLGTLPTYVDPVLPAYLSAGDVVEIATQSVNTTDKSVSTKLTVQAEGAARTAKTRPLSIPAQGSVIERVKLAPDRPGEITLRARLTGADAIEKSIEVRPLGRPVSQEFSGTLAAPRQVSVAIPANVEAYTSKVRLSVFPGALSILRSELAATPGRRGAGHDAYLLLLSGQAPKLLTKLGATADKTRLRRLRIIATQRAMQRARSPSADVAALMAEAAFAHPGQPVLERLGERLAGQLARSQRPDGTFQGGSGWTVQRLLVATADGVRALTAGAGSADGKRRLERSQLRAQGAFERFNAQVDDAYTAAAILASGASDPGLVAGLKERVVKAIKQERNGSRRLVVARGVQRSDGGRPSSIEATALAVLALGNDPEQKEIVADLGATLLSAYRPSRGFGDGRTNLLALQAVLRIFSNPLPEAVTVTLKVDGIALSSARLSGVKLKDVARLTADLGPAAKRGAKRRFEIEASPAIPGLGYAMEVSYSVPWSRSTTGQGLELSMKTDAKPRAGRPLPVTLRAIAPRGAATVAELSLPAGFEVERPKLDQIVNQGKLSGYSLQDGLLTLRLPSYAPGQVQKIVIPFIPTLVGKVHGSASSIALAGRPSSVVHIPPTTWVVDR